MGKIDAEMEARMAGMNYALSLAKAKGIDALENEVKARGALNVGLKIDNKRLNEAYTAMSRTLYQNMQTAFYAVMIDSYGFGKSRLHKLRDQYNKKVECLIDLDHFGEHYVTFEDMAKELNSKYDISLDVEMVKNNQSNFDENSRSRVLPEIVRFLREKKQKKAAQILEKHMHEFL